MSIMKTERRGMTWRGAKVINALASNCARQGAKQAFELSRAIFAVVRRDPIPSMCRLSSIRLQVVSLTLVWQGTGAFDLGAACRLRQELLM